LNCNNERIPHPALAGLERIGLVRLCRVVKIPFAGLEGEEFCPSKAGNPFAYKIPQVYLREFQKIVTRFYSHIRVDGVLKMPKILIVDDKQVILKLLYNELSIANFKVVTLNTIGLIWEYIRDTEPNLVLLGLHSESFNSWQILNDIKKKIPNLPVLIYTIESHRSMNSLKQAIDEVLKNGNISSAFMFHDLKKSKSEKIE
jgi:CheY-like chemotaxis protein